jgi:hypothetical protein
MSELLPCPFCGARAQRIHMEMCCEVLTGGCGAIVSWPICSVTSHAEKLWNTRAARLPDREGWKHIKTLSAHEVVVAHPNYPPVIYDFETGKATQLSAVEQEGKN